MHADHLTSKAITMIRRSITSVFWVGTAVIGIMCAVWIKEVDGWTDLGPCGLSTRGGINDPRCMWPGHKNRKIVKKVAVSLTGRNEVVPHEPEEDEEEEELQGNGRKN